MFFGELVKFQTAYLYTGELFPGLRITWLLPTSQAAALLFLQVHSVPPESLFAMQNNPQQSLEILHCAVLPSPRTGCPLCSDSFSPTLSQVSKSFSSSSSVLSHQSPHGVIFRSTVPGLCRRPIASECQHGGGGGLGHLSEWL